MNDKKTQTQKQIGIIERAIPKFESIQPVQPAYVLLRALLTELKGTKVQGGTQHAESLKKARLDLSKTELCPVREMDCREFEEVKQLLGYQDSSNNLSTVYENILDNPHKFFIDSIFSGHDLVPHLHNFPIKKDNAASSPFGEIEPIDLNDHLALSNAIFITHFDTNHFCKEVTKYKFGVEMNVPEFREFERRVSLDKSTAIPAGILNSKAFRLSNSLARITDALKQSFEILKVLWARFSSMVHSAAEYQPDFSLDRPALFFCSI